MNNIFTKGPSNKLRVLIATLILLVVIFIDTYTTLFKPAKSWVADLAFPIYWVSNIPARVRDWSDDKMNTRSELEARLQQTEIELQVHKGQLLKMADLAAENIRLRHLLNVTELLKDRILVAELMGVSPDPAVQTILINRGLDDKVVKGQAVLDAEGLMGQVVDVQQSFSRVLLISDSTHALPVQVLRNGVRAIAEGVGDYSELRLRYVSPTTDIVKGDKLVSSGLGGRYPVGYPVGTVETVNTPEGRAYMDIAVKPTARLGRSRHLLLVFSDVDRMEE